MRTISYTNRFKRDYKREKAGRHGKSLDNDLMQVVNLLAADTPLPRRNFDHPLSGEWSDHRDCHIKPDLVLIYRKSDKDTLVLVRLGSHSELGLSVLVACRRLAEGATCHLRGMADYASLIRPTSLKAIRFYRRWSFAGCGSRP